MREPIIFMTLLVGLATSIQLQSQRVTESSSEKSLQLVVSASIHKPQPARSVVYTNKHYGFEFALPNSWRGFSILVGEWKGLGPPNGEVKEYSPELSIRHPLWTEADPRQDIPIMVFTHAQWDESEKLQISVTAAPFGPLELGRNNDYVFALPPRYNYNFPDGFQEVDEIISRKPLKAFNVTASIPQHQ
jgi:hypothetical protein